MRRIVDFERQTAAKQILDKIAGAATLSESERKELFSKIVSSEAQRVFRLMKCVAEEFKSGSNTPIERTLATIIDKAVELDPSSANGLSDEASRNLVIACEALTKQMSEDFKAGILDQDRMEMLIGGGPGAYVVGRAILQPITMRFPDT